MTACQSLVAVNEMSFLDTCAVVSGCFFLARDMWRKERTACFIVKKEKKSLLKWENLQKRKLSTDYFAQKDPMI